MRPSRAVPFAQVAAVGRSRPTPMVAAPQTRDITAPARFRAAVAVTLRLTQASVAATRKARAARSPALTVRPAPPRQTDPAREPALALGAAGFAPLSGPDGRLGYLVLLVVGIGFVFAFADATRSVAAEARVRAARTQTRHPTAPASDSPASTFRRTRRRPSCSRIANVQKERNR